jgi:ubiquinone/menaquinone biosynthesis C-methylase UbiE
MISFLKKIWNKEQFHPSFFLGIWINPSFITRRGLLKGVREISQHMNEGKLLDVGCGSKPYEKMFDVAEYIGIDVEVSGHNHSTSKVDKFYDGKKIPFEDEFFENVFSSQVFEHVFNIDELLAEINRVLKSGGKLGFTCPFVWDEHEQPYDFWRYSSFGVERLLTAHGFKLVKLTKSTGYFETIMQMLSAYIAQHVLPRNAYLRILLMPLLVSPVNVIGIVLAKVLPKNTDFYLDNIVIAEKL